MMVGYLYASSLYDRIITRDVAVEFARHLDIEYETRIGVSVMHDDELVYDVECKATGELDL